jgi:hypothetical protein
VVGTVKAEGDGEQAVIGADGLIYVNSEDTAEVVGIPGQGEQDSGVNVKTIPG